MSKLYHAVDLMVYMGYFQSIRLTLLVMFITTTVKKYYFIGNLKHQEIFLAVNANF